LNREFFNNFAMRHLSARSREPLLRTMMACVDSSNLTEALASGCRPLQHFAWQRLTKLPDDEAETLIRKVVEHDSSAALLSILTSLMPAILPLPECIVPRIGALLGASDPQIRHAAAAVIALRRPDSLSALLNDRWFDAEILRRFCLADDASLVIPLAAAFGFPAKSPPPVIGFLANAVWLAENHSSHQQVVEWLIQSCGYCDDPVTPNVLNLLSSGFSYVTMRMTADPRMSKIAHRWLRRIRSFMWRLLPDALDLEPEDNKPFRVEDPLDADLLLAAVRETDRLVFLEQKQLPPFRHTITPRELAPRCFHASSRFVRQQFLETPLSEATRLGIASNDLSAYVIEHARVQLEPDEETRLAQDLEFRGRWRARREFTVGVPVNLTEKFDLHSCLRRSVPGDFVRLRELPQISPGANSVVALAAASGCDSGRIADWLATVENHWSTMLTPIGIEVQMPETNRDEFAAWKQSLPFLNVPSPVRPEFGATLEAAFRPAKSFHAMVLGPLLLARLGVITAPQEMAMHISLQGDLGDSVNSIAFPQHFIHPGERMRNRPDRCMSRIMSKGFVCSHDDAESVSPITVSTVRTELRLFRLFARVDSPDASISDGGVERHVRIRLSRGFVSDLIAVNILGSAVLSNCPVCSGLISGYVREIELAAGELPAEFGRLLVSNYYESTGDPRDEQLLAMLPIFACWSAVRKIVRAQEWASQLDQQFRRLRHQHVQLLLNHWHKSHHINIDDLSFADNEIQLRLPRGLDDLLPSVE
jgi:hypothetical protein